MFDITIQGQGFSQFDDLARKLKSLDRPLGEVGAFLERKAKLRFASETAPDGRKWAALRPSTIAQKKRLGKSSRILTRDGGMVASIAFRVSGNAVTVKPSVDYAIFHQTGTSKIPARPFMGFEAGDAEEIAQIIADYLGG
jgi:phage virion morphogenesis protein